MTSLNNQNFSKNIKTKINAFRKMTKENPAKAFFAFIILKELFINSYAVFNNTMKMDEMLITMGFTLVGAAIAAVGLFILLKIIDKVLDIAINTYLTITNKFKKQKVKKLEKELLNQQLQIQESKKELAEIEKQKEIITRENNVIDFQNAINELRDRKVTQ